MKKRWPAIPAKREDWQCSAMPEQHTQLSLSLQYSNDQMARIRVGFVPSDQDEKWFLYFSDGVLHMHRSWTGFCIFQLRFRKQADAWLADQAVANRDPEQYTSTSEEEDAQLIALVIADCLLESSAPQPHGLQKALALAMEPGYLGSPKIVGALIAEHFGYLLRHVLPEADFERRQANRQACRQNTQRLERIFSGEDPAYTPLPGWHTAEQLGAALVRAFRLDADYCSGESLAYIVNDALAALELHVRRFVEDAAQGDPPEQEDVDARSAALLSFVTCVLLGTHVIAHPGKTLADFQWGPASESAAALVRLVAPIRSPKDNPMLHPRSQPDGTPVKIKQPSTPSHPSSWSDRGKAATVVPDGPVPVILGVVALAPLPLLPRGAAGWDSLAAGAPQFEEPPFPQAPGLKPAAGVAIEEPDGRVWLVSPTNAFGGYVNTLPKGRIDKGMSARATAVREAVEETGLLVQLTGHLVDCPRSVTLTRYYRARRVGGTPAGMGWESQAVHLVPLEQLSGFLTHPNDKPVLDALLKLNTA